jgi:hypothetical protein
VRRGAASCRAVLGSCPVAAAVRAAAQVPSPRSSRGWPSAPGAVTQARSGRPAGVAGREDVRTRGCPDAGQAGRCPVRLVGSAVGMSVQPVERTSSIHASGVQCIQVSGRTGSGVRGAAAALSAPRWPCSGSVWRAALAGRRGSTCPRGPRAAWTPACIGPEGKRWCGVGRGWLARGLT